MKTIRKVTINGLKDIMFDRYAGDNKTTLEPHQKMYLRKLDDGGPIIGLPSTNIMSFLTAINTNSAPKRLRDARKYRAVANGILSFTDIQEQFIPFIRDGEPIRFGQFVEGRDEASGVYIHTSVARLDKGIPNPKVRPTLPLPWSLSFSLVMYPNKEVKEEEIHNLFVEGGIALGLGTFRGVFGKFEVVEWV